MVLEPSLRGYLTEPSDRSNASNRRFELSWGVRLHGSQTPRRLSAVGITRRRHPTLSCASHRGDGRRPNHRSEPFGKAWPAALPPSLSTGGLGKSLLPSS